MDTLKETMHFSYIKGVKSRSWVDALSELFPIHKGRQLHIHYSQWSFFQKRASVTQITMARMGQIERKWGLIIKTNYFYSLITSSRTQN